MTFLLRAPMKNDVANPLKDWLPDVAWFQSNKLIEIEPFESFTHSLSVEVPTRFMNWYNDLVPEEKSLPQDWKKLDNMMF